MRRLPFALLAAAALSGCTIELQHDLAEQDANDIYVLLSENGISAKKSKDPDSGNEIRYLITVAKADASTAARLLREYSLPRPASGGFAEVRKGKGMIPTQVEERAIFLEALGGEISNALNKVDGVLEARTVVMLPERNDLSTPDKKPLPSASVFVKYRINPDGRPPLDETQVRRFVSSAVEELKPDAVTVIMSPAQPPSAELNPGQQLVDVIGLRMTRDSASQFRTMLVISGLLILALVAFSTWTFMRGAGVPIRPRRRPESPG
jgi:type III secretion protein J